MLKQAAFFADRTYVSAHCGNDHACARGQFHYRTVGSPAFRRKQAFARFDASFSV
jgi:hypothetical protein